jgi:hypothetical protein
MAAATLTTRLKIHAKEASATLSQLATAFVVILIFSLNLWFVAERKSRNIALHRFSFVRSSKVILCQNGSTDQSGMLPLLPLIAG